MHCGSVKVFGESITLFLKTTRKNLSETYCVQEAMNRAAPSHLVSKTINISLPIKDHLKL